MIDTSRWDEFAPRSGDIFVCTPPKSGTTWMQAICTLLVQGRSELTEKLSETSPWLDRVDVPIKEVTNALDAQSHRRVIKTHTPLDAIPCYERCNYLAVYRDPRDVFISLRNHAANMRRNPVKAVEDPNRAFCDWVDRPWSEGPGLSSLIYHFKSFRKFEEVENITLFHYSNMVDDLRKAIRSIAATLGIEIAEVRLSSVLETVSFANMKQSYESFAPSAGTGFWLDDARFFSSGTVGQWRGVLGSDALEKYDSRVRELLPEEDVLWLEGGSES
jgi:aryl sulfotransferase